MYGDARRAVYIELPTEAQPQDGRVWVGKLERSLYGTRDAPQIWHDHLSDSLRALGFKASKLNPGLFYHPSKKMELAVHVDDLFIIGLRKVLQWVKAELEKIYMVNVKPLLIVLKA